jgi:hypothetical protein
MAVCTADSIEECKHSMILIHNLVDVLNEDLTVPTFAGASRTQGQARQPIMWTEVSREGKLQVYDVPGSHQEFQRPRAIVILDLSCDGIGWRRRLSSRRRRNKGRLVTWT